MGLFSNEILIDIATFLARRWSTKNNVVIEFSSRNEIVTKNKEHKIILMPIKKYEGNDFDKYRQFRIALWYESMRLRFCKKILSNDHAFGFILNTIETRRIEILGKKLWLGMEDEVIFNYSYIWNYRPILNSVYSKSRIIEAFYQYFLTNDIKGEIQSSHFKKVIDAVKYSKKILEDAISNNYDTDWLEKKIPHILKILEIDALLTIPIQIKSHDHGITVSQKNISNTVISIIKKKYPNKNYKKILEGKEIVKEYENIINENTKNMNIKKLDENIGIKEPNIDTDNKIIYDVSVINNLKNRFKQLKTKLIEKQANYGDEFDEENYIEGYKPFIINRKNKIDKKIVILLDHSSSISKNQLEYKKATLTLCEVLNYLHLKFSVYAFNTQERSIICWFIKSFNTRWNNVAVRRLANIIANGGTPLAEVYTKIKPLVLLKKPNIFLTLTDGEPTDPNAVKQIIKTFKKKSIKMIAIGFGINKTHSLSIANSLKYLGYEDTLAISEVKDIKKIINMLNE